MVIESLFNVSIASVDNGKSCALIQQTKQKQNKIITKRKSEVKVKFSRVANIKIIYKCIIDVQKSITPVINNIKKYCKK